MQKKSMSSGVKNWAKVGKQQMCQHSVWQWAFFSFSPPLLKDQTTTVILLNSFRIAQHAEKDSMHHFFYFNFFSNCFSVAPVSESKRRSKVKAKFYEKLKRKCEVFVWVISFGIHQEFEKSDMGWWGWCLKKREIDFSFRDISSATKRNVSSA